MKFRFLSILFLFLLHGVLTAQNTIDRNIEWEKPIEAKLNGASFNLLSFKGAEYSNDMEKLPVFAETILLSEKAEKVKAIFTETQFEIIPQNELKYIQLTAKILSEIKIESHVQIQRKKFYLNYSFVPIRKNSQTGNFEKLVSFKLNYEISEPYKYNKALKQFSNNSVLSSGKWVKITVEKDGIYKITANELKNMGFDNPLQVKLFGNDASMLPMSNKEDYYNDLSEMAIERTSDYIVFFAQGPTRWNYNSNYEMFIHKLHTYSDFSYYFLTDEIGVGKNIETETPSSLPALYTVTSFDDYDIHEKEDTNL